MKTTLRNKKSYDDCICFDMLSKTITSFDGKCLQNANVDGFFIRDNLKNIIASFSRDDIIFISVNKNIFRQDDSELTLKYINYGFYETFKLYHKNSLIYKYSGLSTPVIIRRIKDPTYDGLDEMSDDFYKTIYTNWKASRRS
jgi:hypothetical protein